MTKKFPNFLAKEKVIQIQEAQRIPNNLDSKSQIIIKMTRLKDRERTLKAIREKQVVTYKGPPIRLACDYSSEACQARREWHGLFKVMKSKGLQPTLPSKAII